FFQAEDGIRDFHVTGVQTCALPICPRGGSNMNTTSMTSEPLWTGHSEIISTAVWDSISWPTPPHSGYSCRFTMKVVRELRMHSRSEERRVGKECSAPKGPRYLRQKI